MVILGDREVAFFGDWGQASFSPSIYGILIIYIVAEIQQYLVESIFQTSAGISSSPLAFPNWMFFTAFNNSSIVKSPFLMFNSSVKTGVISSSLITGGLPRRSWKCCCQSFTHSSWFDAFSLHLLLLFLPLESYLSIGYCCSPLIQLGPAVEVSEAFYLINTDWKSEYGNSPNILNLNFLPLYQGQELFLTSEKF